MAKYKDKYEIVLNEETHTYTITKNGKEIPVDASVTGVLKAVSIAKDMSNIPTNVLEKARNRGTENHKEVEKFILSGGKEQATNELAQMSCNAIELTYDLDKENVVAEFPLVIIYKGKVICGQADIINFTKKDLIDEKYTAKYEKDYVESQCNLYAYAINKMNGIVNGVDLSNKKIESLAVLHNGIFHQLRMWNEKEVEDLLDSYIDNLPYFPVELSTANELAIQSELKIAELEQKIAQMKKAVEDRRNLILEEMKRKDIKKIEIDGVTYTRIDEQLRTTFDSKLFKEREPDLYKAYSKTSVVKESLRVKVDPIVTNNIIEMKEG